MKNRDYYRLLINKEPIELKANSKWERDLQIDQTSLKTIFSRVKNVCKDNLGNFISNSYMKGVIPLW